MLKGHRCKIAELLGAVLLLTLSGCTGTLKMPINAYSHIRLEATPLSNEFEVSYHLYDALPALADGGNWITKLKVDGLGTVYDSKETGSPAAKRLEDSWERLWVDGRPTWTTVERMVLDSEDGGVAQIQSSTTKRTSKTRHAPRRTTHIMQLAELPLFLFSRSPQW
jgi:hypothetical protein